MVINKYHTHGIFCRSRQTLWWIFGQNRKEALSLQAVKVTMPHATCHTKPHILLKVEWSSIKGKII